MIRFMVALTLFALLASSASVEAQDALELDLSPNATSYLLEVPLIVAEGVVRTPRYRELQPEVAWLLDAGLGTMAGAGLMLPAAIRSDCRYSSAGSNERFRTTTWIGLSIGVVAVGTALLSLAFAGRRYRSTPPPRARRAVVHTLMSLLTGASFSAWLFGANAEPIFCNS